MRWRTGVSSVVMALMTATVLAAGGDRVQNGGGQSPAGLCLSQQPCPPLAVGVLQIAEYGNSATPIYGFGFSVTNTGSAGSGGGGGTGKASFSDVTVSRLPDSLSPQLFLDTATGKHLKWVEITLKRGTAADETYRLIDVLVTGFNTTPEFEQVSFTYSRIELTVNGRMVCYDITGNLSCS